MRVNAANNTCVLTYGGMAAITRAAELLVDSCSFVGNTAPKAGSGLGGALFALNVVQFHVVNTTMENNTAFKGGSIVWQGQMSRPPPAQHLKVICQQHVCSTDCVAPLHTLHAQQASGYRSVCSARCDSKGGAGQHTSTLCVGRPSRCDAAGLFDVVERASLLPRDHLPRPVNVALTTSFHVLISCCRVDPSQTATAAVDSQQHLCGERSPHRRRLHLLGHTIQQRPDQAGQRQCHVRHQQLHLHPQPGGHAAQLVSY